MIPSYKIVIQAVPQRIAWAIELQRKTGAEIILQPPEIHSDENYIRVLESVGEADYLVRLEDDALLAPDFIPALEYALPWIAVKRCKALMLYCNQHIALDRTPSKGFNIELIDPTLLNCGVGLVISREIIPDYISFYRRKPQPSKAHIYGPQDVSLGLYLRQRLMSLCVLCPSIVQHRDAGSLLGHNDKPPRYSKSFRARYGF